MPKQKIRPEAMTTAQLLAAARCDPDPVSFFGAGTSRADSQEGIFVVKGKRNVQRVEDLLVGLGLMTTQPIIFNKD
jgi:hypothetical protein